MNTQNTAEAPEAALIRMVDNNGWEWRTAVKVMSRLFHVDYTIAELKALHKEAKRTELQEQTD